MTSNNNYIIKWFSGEEITPSLINMISLPSKYENFFIKSKTHIKLLTIWLKNDILGYSILHNTRSSETLSAEELCEKTMGLPIPFDYYCLYIHVKEQYRKKGLGLFIIKTLKEYLDENNLKMYLVSNSEELTEKFYKTKCNEYLDFCGRLFPTIDYENRTLQFHQDELFIFKNPCLDAEQIKKSLLLKTSLLLTFKMGVDPLTAMEQSRQYYGVKFPNKSGRKKQVRTPEEEKERADKRREYLVEKNRIYRSRKIEKEKEEQNQI